MSGAVISSNVVSQCAIYVPFNLLLLHSAHLYFLMTPRTYCLDDEDNSSLSDYDSEWTQVSGLEDDDFPPLSAASERSSSRADTIDEGIDVDVWEGLADGLHRSFSRLSDTQCSVDGGATREALTCEDTQSLSASVATKFSEDDDRVNVALNSSVIGTLRASRTRSASSSLYASLTESQSKLRLSFPDPLSSSKDDTGDDHDPQQIDFKSHNLAEDDSKPNITSVASSFSDIEGPATLEASEKSDKNAISTVFQPIPIYASCILSIALYGSASSSKWQIVDRIMSLVLQFNDTSPSIVEDGCNRRYYFESSVLKNQFTSLYEQFFVRIIDRTSSSSEMVSCFSFVFLFCLTLYRSSLIPMMVYLLLLSFYFLQVYPLPSPNTIITFR